MKQLLVVLLICANIYASAGSNVAGRGAEFKQSLRAKKLNAGKLLGFRDPNADLPYDPTLAYMFTSLNSAAYCSFDQLTNWNCDICKNVDMVPGTVVVCNNTEYDLLAYVGLLQSGQIAISFRGTEPSSLANWIKDLDFTKTYPYPQCPSCGVHQGFYESWTALQPDIMNAVNQLGGKNRKIVVTGYSLGAAMATFCNFELATSGYSIETSYTNGEPRTGDSNFASFYMDTMGVNATFRLVHYADIVPHLPPELFGFEHMPTEVWYQENNVDYQVCSDSNGEDPNCSDSLLLPDSISDHLTYLNIDMAGSC